MKFLLTLPTVLVHIILVVSALPLDNDLEIEIPHDAASTLGLKLDTRGTNKKPNPCGKCDVIDKYDVDWFISQAAPEYRAMKGTCLFYTRGLSRRAQVYAKERELVTIWDLWPKQYYRKTAVLSNPLRCIMQDSSPGGKRQTYFENMSTAMARMCDIYVTVMDKSITAYSKTYETIAQSGIWFRKEFPELTGNGWNRNKCYYIEATSPDGMIRFPYWSRHSVESVGQSEDYELKKRGLMAAGEGIADGYDTQEWWEEDEIFDEFEHSFGEEEHCDVL